MGSLKRALFLWIVTTIVLQISNISAGAPPGDSKHWAPNADPTQAFVAPGNANTRHVDGEVELSISCTKLPDKDIGSKSDPMCVTYLRAFNSNQWEEFHRSEIIKNNLNPKFTQKPSVPYTFKTKQSIMFKIYDVDSPKAKLDAHDYLGYVECSLGELVTRGQMTLPLRKMNRLKQEVTSSKSSITITAEKLIPTHDKIHMEFRGSNIAKKDWFGKSDPFLDISKRMENGGYELVYKTEVINNTKTPHWRRFHVLLKSLCNANPDRILKFTCYDYDRGGKRDYIGEFTTTLRELRDQKVTYFQLTDSRKGNKNTGNIHVEYFLHEEVPTFADYIRGGLQIHCTIAIDFTLSNGDPVKPESLHHIDPNGSMNQYELAIHSVVDIIQDYDWDQRFPVYGFGGKHPKGDTNAVVCHNFNLNPDQSECHGVQGVVAAYKRVLSEVELSQPTHFAPMINTVIQMVNAFPNHQDNYLILLILTDGEIMDMVETEAAINKASKLPISIIIVGIGGIGGKPFGRMEQLDGDHIATTQDGQKVRRDIVQFVPLRKFKKYEPAQQQRLLAEDVLAEVPDQVVSFMKSHGFRPRDPNFAHALLWHQQSMNMQQGFNPYMAGGMVAAGGMIAAGGMMLAANGHPHQMPYPGFQHQQSMGQFPPPNAPGYAGYMQPPPPQGNWYPQSGYPPPPPPQHHAARGGDFQQPPPHSSLSGDPSTQNRNLPQGGDHQHPPPYGANPMSYSYAQPPPYAPNGYGAPANFGAYSPYGAPGPQNGMSQLSHQPSQVGPDQQRTFDPSKPQTGSMTHQQAYADYLDPSQFPPPSTGSMTQVGPDQQRTFDPSKTQTGSMTHQQAYADYLDPSQFPPPSTGRMTQPSQVGPDQQRTFDPSKTQTGSMTQLSHQQPYADYLDPSQFPPPSTGSMTQVGPDQQRNFDPSKTPTPPTENMTHFSHPPSYAATDPQHYMGYSQFANPSTGNMTQLSQPHSQVGTDHQPYFDPTKPLENGTHQPSPVGNDQQLYFDPSRSPSPSSTSPSGKHDPSRPPSPSSTSPGKH